MDEQANIEKVRWFLSELEPAELRRIVEAFRMQMGLPPIPDQVQPKITDGRQRPLPGIPLLRNFSAKAGSLT